MKQARSEARKQAKIKRHEKAVELQMEIEDRAAARRLERELAEMHRGSIRWAGRFKVREQPERPERRTSPVRKRSSAAPTRLHSAASSTVRPPSSWVIDDLGFKGVIWQQSYLGRKSNRFHPGAARENWDYIVRDEAVLLDAEGEPIIVSNMGDDWVEIGTAWQAMEDASTRANAKIQMLAIAPFDSDMSRAEMVDALTHFCATVLEPIGLPYSAAIHAPPAQGDERNFHPHLAFSLRPMRRVEPYCWDIADEVCGELDGRDGVQMLRHLWAHSMSEAAERARSNRRYTGLGYSARGLDLDAGEHLGEARSAIVARDGHVWAHERNRIKNQRNALRRAVRDADRKIEALTKVRDAVLARIARTQASPDPTKIVTATPAVVPPTRLRPASAVRPSDSLTKRAVRPPRSRDVSRAGARVRGPQKSARSTPGASRLLQASVLPRAAKVSMVATQPLPAMAVPTFAPTAIVPVERLSASQEVVGARHPNARKSQINGSTERTVAQSPGERRTRHASIPVRPATAVTETTASPTSRTIGHDFLECLAKARARRDRERAAKRKRDQQMSLADMPSLADRPRLDIMEAFPAMPAAAISAIAAEEDYARLQQLMRLDAYVADYGGEGLDVGTMALKAIGVDDAWLSRPWVQRGLAVVRARQQVLVGAMIVDADTRLLAYAKAGTRFWPRDLDPERLRRLNRWAGDPGFQRDVFEVERRIYQAHRDNDEIMRGQTPAFEGLDDAKPYTGIAGPPYADGFGGWTDTPPPVFIHRTVSPRTAPFDLATGAPHPALLRLVHQCGTRPQALAFAEDGKLTTLPGASKGIEPLLQLWRDDPQVEALVVETITASRAAGHPIWPEQYRIAIAEMSVSARPPVIKPNRKRAPAVQQRDR